MGNVPQKDGHSEAAISSGDSVTKGNRGQQQGSQSRHHHQQAYNMGVGYGASMLQNRSPSDASMNSCPRTSPLPHYDQQQGQGYLGQSNSSNNTSNNAVGGINLDVLSLDDDQVPTVFRWEHGGRQVYITGTFNGWSRQIPMHRSGNDFTYIHNLKRGKHAFKFIVDDEWRFAPDQATVADIEGRINNFIDVSDFRAYTGDRNFEDCLEGVTSAAPTTNKVSTSSANISGAGSAARHGSSFDSGAPITTSTAAVQATPDPMEDEGFGNTMPDIDEYTKEPPPLPPHLRHIILNKPPQLNDTAALPVPQHVALNHLYCTAIKDNMMVLGVTQRYKTKFVTTVYYSPC